MIDNDRATRGQCHLTRISRFDLVFNLKAREQRHIVAVELHPADILRHDVVHIDTSLFVDFVGIDENFANILMEVVADHARNQVVFGVEQAGPVDFQHVFRAGLVDGIPKVDETGQIPLELFGIPTDTGGARDHAHALRHFELIDGLTQFGTILAFNAARHTSTARIVWHEDDIATGEADKGGECSAFVAALILVHLNENFLAFFQRILNTRLVDVDSRLEIGAVDFFEWQKTTAFCTVVNETGFKTGGDAIDNALVNIALALLFVG